MKLRHFFLIAAATLTLAGCSDMPPKCDSADTKTVLNEIMDESISLVSSMIGVQMTFNIEQHKTVRENEKSKIYYCSAILNMSALGETTQEKIDYSVSHDPDNSDQFYVEIL